ncbi:hypothetical protein F4778DRAFT_779112 [Xylariomycetidae sp. FL2044]|nr:hypothetical protein F4778DRAFT_779112 [Xylariomycetidae sp. FL2044]
MKPSKVSYPNLTNNAYCIKSHMCKFHPDGKKHLIYLAGGKVKNTTNEPAYMLFMKAEDGVNWLCRFCKKTFDSHSNCDHHAWLGQLDKDQEFREGPSTVTNFGLWSENETNTHLLDHNQASGVATPWFVDTQATRVRKYIRGLMRHLPFCHVDGITLIQEVRSRWNAWVIQISYNWIAHGEWGYRRAGEKPQLVSATVVDSSIRSIKKLILSRKQRDTAFESMWNFLRVDLTTVLGLKTKMNPGRGVGQPRVERGHRLPGSGRNRFSAVDLRRVAAFLYAADSTLVQMHPEHRARSDYCQSVRDYSRVSLGYKAEPEADGLDQLEDQVAPDEELLLSSDGGSETSDAVYVGHNESATVIMPGKDATVLKEPMASKDQEKREMSQQELDITELDRMRAHLASVFIELPECHATMDAVIAGARPMTCPDCGKQYRGPSAAKSYGEHCKRDHIGTRCTWDSCNQLYQNENELSNGKKSWKPEKRHSYDERKNDPKKTKRKSSATMSSRHAKLRSSPGKLSI